jgi:undecaprenyl-diphosphatase
LARFENKPLILGIRPEDLEDAALAPDAPADRRIAANVDIREDMGSDVYVHFGAGGRPVRGEDVAAAIGEEAIETHLGNPWQIAINLAVFGVLLYVADRSAQTRKLEDIGLWTALGVGAAQAIALMPGVSRSGITITAGRFLKLDRDSAARLSFFLLIPIVFGAVVYKGLKHVVFGSLPSGWEGPFLVGTVAAAGVGLIAIDLLLGYLRRHDYTIFVVYRLCLAAAILILIATGVKSATF